MMEFLLFLTPIGREIYELASHRVTFAENHAICRKHDIFGYYDSNGNIMYICTDRMKQTDNPKYWINETLYHEAVHMAQDCNGKGKVWFKPFGINPSQMPLSQRRLDDIESALKIAPNVRAIEHEAFWMEDKPEKVKYVVQKYCF